MQPPAAPFGDHVQIVEAPETVVSGYANREGVIWGFTTPSVTNVEVIGGIEGDYALNVHFEDAPDAWFTPSLVRILDHAPGTVIKIGSTAWTREADGGD